MPITNQAEQTALEEYIVQQLKKLMTPNVNRLKAGLTILMTSDRRNFEAVVAKTIQEELKPFKELLQSPETIAPLSSQTAADKQAVLDYIKQFTLDNIKILDERISILPNTYTVEKTIKEGERLKSVIHTSALRNVVNAALFHDKMRERFSRAGYEGEALENLVKNTSESMSRLYLAVANGDLLNTIKELSSPGIDVNLPNAEGLSLLQLAVREGHSKIVEVLLKEHNINVNQVSINGWTALHFAARLGEADIVRMLLAAPKIDINMANSDGWTALHWAAWHGYLKVVNLLVSDPHIEVNKRDSSQGIPLHWAARNGQADVIVILLSVSELEVNAQDIDKKTPLHYAVAFDHAPATSSLITSNKLDVNIQDIDGLTPLHWAARNGSLELVGLLLELPNIKLDLKDNNQMIPADWAKHNQYPELVPILLPNRMKLPSYLRIYWDKLKLRFRQAWSRG